MAARCPLSALAILRLLAFGILVVTRPAWPANLVVPCMFFALVDVDWMYSIQTLPRLRHAFEGEGVYRRRQYIDVRIFMQHYLI